MKAFAALLDQLSLEASRNRKLALIVAYLRAAPDPDRGYALAALCGELTFHSAKPALLRALISERVDPTLFDLSYDFVGDLSETISLLWPGSAGPMAPPRLVEVVETLQASGKALAATRVIDWLDALGETERWALLKLITGALRVGVSTALAKQAVAIYGDTPVMEIEEIWHGLEPPYSDLFAWLDGKAGRPEPGERLTFSSPMLAQPLDEADLTTLQPGDFFAEWKWDGIRVQAVARSRNGARHVRLFSRSGDDIGAAFTDMTAAIDVDAVIDGELVVRDGDVTGSFSALQQRLNRKAVSPRLMASHPAHIVAYDLLFAREADGAWRDWRPAPFLERRARLAALVTQHTHGRISLSPEVVFSEWVDLAARRAESHADPAIEGVMLKRRDSAYVAGRPRGPWWKWKRDPHRLDCVLMYAQRGHGKRSSLYSDYTFGLWRGDELVPVGKAYFGFTDEELGRLDRHVRHNTVQRFGPVREVAHTLDAGLVLEIAFEGVQVSTRHKSGYAMRFPRVFRIRWDKPPREADRLEALAALAR